MMMKGLGIVVLLSIVLTSCAPEKKDQLIGKWFKIEDTKETIEFKEDLKTIFNKKDQIDYSFLKENIIEIHAGTEKEEYQIGFKGDTLIMLGKESRDKYFRVSALSNPEKFKYLVASNLSKIMRVSCIGLDIAKIDPKNLPDTVHLQSQFSRFVKDTSTVYLGTALLADRSTTDVSIMLKEDKFGYLEPIWRETVEAFTKRTTYALLRQRVNNIKLEPSRRNKYTGSMQLADGNTLQIEVDTKKGWTPTDLKSMEIYTKYFINREFGAEVCKESTLETDDNYHFHGKAVLASGEELDITTDKLKGWGTKSDLKNAKIYAKLRIEQSLAAQIQEINTTKVNEDEYKTIATLTNGEQIKLMVSPKYRGWYPIDEVKNLETVVRLQMNAGYKQKNKKHEVTQVRLTPVKNTQGNQGSSYQGFVAYKDGRTVNFAVQHKGKSFRWEILRGKAEGGQTL